MGGGSGSRRLRTSSLLMVAVRTAPWSYPLRKWVRGLVVKKAQVSWRPTDAPMRFALDQGYKGIVTIDGNDKDDPEAIPRFIEALEGGIDFCPSIAFPAWWWCGVNERRHELCDPVYPCTVFKHCVWI